MAKWRRLWKHLRLSLMFALLVFLIMAATMILVFLGLWLGVALGLVEPQRAAGAPLVLFAIISILVGTVFSVIVSRVPLKPLRQIMEAVDAVAGGDYSVRLHLKGPEEYRQLGERFNHMAQEIGSVEMLRSDFVNNFSHEFKTPIVSIRGFAKAMKWEDLTQDERNEYLDIIISESERLTELATNVLNLSKLEQQTILTDRECFNVSEQIRLVIALLHDKMARKNLSILFDNEEIYVKASEELLRQMWINLVDNAIKFAPEGGEVEIVLTKAQEQLTVTIANTNGGSPISPEQAEHIFDKFYQADTSHATKGNGLGLTMVRKIAQLHGGEARLADSNGTETVFEVKLPVIAKH